MDQLNRFNNNDDIFRLSLVDFINKELNDKIISREIEKSIYNYCVKLAIEKNIKRRWNNTIFRNLYLSKCRSIYSNITDSYIHNVEFKKKILSKEIDAKSIAELSSYDIFPENWKILLDEKMRIDKLKFELKPEAMTDVFKCRKCNSRSCSYYEVQTRSADEPMTQFIDCLNCGNRWRQ